MALHLFAGLRVRDFEAARAWYERLLGEPSFLPHATEAVWTLAEERSVYVVEHPEGAGHSAVTVFVDDLDARLAAAAAGGIEPVERETYSNGVRKATFRDPDGNEIGFGGAPVETGVDPAARAMLERLYERFNARDIDAVLAGLTPDVDWPNGWEGGYVHGHEAVRDYWTRQWREIDGTVTPEAFAAEPDGRIDVTVHQVVRDLDGAVMHDTTVHHVYRFRGDLVEHMEIRA